MINQTTGLSFNGIPQAMTLLLERQEKLEEEILALHQYISQYCVADHHYPMSVEEASKYIGIPVSTIYEMLERRELPGCKMGKRWQIYRDDVDRTLEAHRMSQVPLTAEEQNAQILASKRRKPKSAGKYDHLVSPQQQGERSAKLQPLNVGKGLSHQSGITQC